MGTSRDMQQQLKQESIIVLICIVDAKLVLDSRRKYADILSLAPARARYFFFVLQYHDLVARCVNDGRCWGGNQVMGCGDLTNHARCCCMHQALYRLGKIFPTRNELRARALPHAGKW